MSNSFVTLVLKAVIYFSKLPYFQHFQVNTDLCAGDLKGETKQKEKVQNQHFPSSVTFQVD